MPSDLRAETEGLTTVAAQDLATLWAIAEAQAAIEFEIALRDLLPSIVTEYGAAASALAADWYDLSRTEAEIGGQFSAIPLEPSDRGTQDLIGWASKTASTDEAFQSLVQGGVQRRIADHVRYTVTDSAIADPKAVGWQRVGDGDTCTFCAMLIGRGAVYRTAEADFKAHDSCGCSAVPVWH